MEDDYLANKEANTTPDAMAGRAKHHHSIKGACLTPLPSILNVVPSGLHISLMVGLALVRLLESWCDILDQEEDISRLADLVEEIFAEVSDDEGCESGEQNSSMVVEEAAGTSAPGDEVLPELAAEVGVESMEGEIAGVEGGENTEQVGEKEAEQAVNERTSRQTRREEKERAQEELARAEQVVQEQEVKVARVVKELKERKELLQRIVLNKSENYVAVEELAKTKHKVKSVLQRYRYCSMTYCVLTHYDRRISFDHCTACNRRAHVECELWGLGIPEVEFQVEPALEEVSDQEERLGQVCSTCRPPGQRFESYQSMQKLVEPVVRQARDKLVLAETVLAKAKAEEGRCREVLANWVGEHRKQLLHILENVLKVAKTAYQGGNYVGNHVQKILNSYKVLSVVLADRPKVKELFEEFCGHYLEVHHLLKAARWLTPAEVSLFFCTAWLPVFLSICLSLDRDPQDLLPRHWKAVAPGFPRLQHPPQD